jgi:hypothetical protein
MGCWEVARGGFTYKNQSECVECGGDWVPITRWSQGQWLQGDSIPLQWKSKAFVQTNTWGPGIEWSDRSFVRILNILLQPIGAKIAYLAKAEGFCRWGLYSGILRELAYQCGNDGNKRSLATRAPGSPIKIGEFRAWSNQEQAFDAGRVYLEVYANTITSNDYSDISVYAQALSTIPEASGSRSALYKRAVSNHEIAMSGKRQQPAPLSLEVYVSNSRGAVIGQVLSDGYMVEFSPQNNGPFQVCVSKRSDIDVNGCFDTIDFASGSPLVPIESVITFQDDIVVCADFTSTGTVFVIGRVAGWDTATRDQCITPENTDQGSSASSIAVGFSFLLSIILANLF